MNKNGLVYNVVNGAAVITGGLVYAGITGMCVGTLAGTFLNILPYELGKNTYVRGATYVGAVVLEHTILEKTYPIVQQAIEETVEAKVDRLTGVTTKTYNKIVKVDRSNSRLTKIN